MNINEIKSQYLENIKIINAYMHALNVFHFDHSTIAPKKGMEERNETLSILSNIIFQKQMDPDHIFLLKTLYNNKEKLDKYTKRLVELNYEQYVKSQNITPELQYQYSIACSNGYTSWLNAKEKKDYNLFKDALGEIIKLQQEMIKLRPTQMETPYDSLLDDYEKEHNTLVLDKFFNELKEGIVPLLKEIMKSNKQIREDFLTNKVKITKQEKFSLYLLKLIGFDLDAGLLSTTEHPFTSKISNHDVRVTTHYYENLFVSNIFSTIHEGGHAIFGQNEPTEVIKNYVGDNMSAAMHECISRMYENMVGRSQEFVHAIYPKFSKLFKSEFKDVTELELYEGINAVHPSLIRIEADELTYCLHIIIRYEIERDLINGTLSVENAKEAWNKKYFDYLGVTPENDSEGILQDVHWSDGSFGYFPSYALGNAYAAQIFHKMQNEIDVLSLIKEGKVTSVKKWLTKNVFKYASMLDPNEWIVKVTGEPLNTKYYIEYLQNKFKNLYNL